MIKLHLKDIKISYPGKDVIRDVSGEFHSGEFVSLIGPNGTGKTTLIRAIAGLIKSQGRIKITDGGKPLKSTEISYIPQMIETNTNLTVFEIVLLGLVSDLSWRVKKEQLDAVHNILEELELIEISDKPFSKLSGGQRQMVTMAQALICRPKVLLLDEPTSALDLKHQLQLLSLAHKYTKENSVITVVVLHDLALAARYSDKLCLLNGGYIAKLGNVTETLTPKLLKTVYGIEVDVSISSKGYITITPYEQNCKLALQR